MDVSRKDQYPLSYVGSRTAGYDKGYKTNAGGSYGDNMADCFASACRAILEKPDRSEPAEADAVSGTLKAAEEGNREDKSLLEQMQEHMALMRERIKTGTIQPAFQIGAQAYTKEAWEKLLEKFDETEEMLRVEIEAEIEAAKEQAQKDELTEVSEKTETT